jgi:DNA invertase Pin-like site-specific DNA recombinase
MMNEIKTANVSGLICTALTRFGRSTEQVLIDYKTIVGQGKEIIFVDNNIESNTTNGKAMLGMLAVFAEWERDTIRERLTGGREFAKKTKTKSGLPMNRPSIEIDWKEYDEYKKMGASISFIQKKVVDKRTGKKISKSAFYKAVKNREDRK